MATLSRIHGEQILIWDGIIGELEESSEVIWLRRVEEKSGRVKG